MRAWVLGVVVCVVGRASSVSVRKMPLSEPPKRSMAKVATSVALASTGAVFLRHKMFATEVAGAKDAKMVQGLVFSFVALCGNTAASLLRKQVSRATTVRPAEQVGVATAIQGCVAVAYCARQGLLSGTTVGAAFLAPAIGSSVLNALTKTLETKAYAITDVSLCAPFLAFDPVMQFLLPALLAPAACALGGVACSEARSDFPPYHPLAVACVATGAYLLSKVAAERAAAGAAKKVDDEAKDGGGLVAGLPLGAWFILFNCCVYAVAARAPRGSREFAST